MIVELSCYNCNTTAADFLYFKRFYHPYAVTHIATMHVTIMCGSLNLTSVSPQLAHFNVGHHFTDYLTPQI